MSELWEFGVKDGNFIEPHTLRTQDDCGINATGEPDLFSRVVLGYSQKLGDALLALGVPKEQLLAAIAAIQSKTEEGLAPPPMPIQDAIDLADFLVEATKSFTRFKLGAPTVGGPTEIAAITKHEGFKWVTRKHYFDTRLNPKEE